LPTGGAATTWSTIDRPEWTNQFGWANVGPFISPAETTNFDIITNNSITPVSHQVYNLGQRYRRYNLVHTNFINCTTAVFDDGVRQTYFSGSYNELRDRPASVGQPDYYDRLDFFSDKRLSLTTMSTTEFSGLKLNGLLDCQKIQVNILSVLGGEITNIGYPDFSHSATPKSYVDSRAPSWLTDIGSTQASIKLGGFENNMSNKRITNVASPTASTDAATKAYVDALRADYEALLARVTQPVVHLFTTKSTISGRIRVDVAVDSFVNFCSCSIYWIFDPDNMLQYYQVDLIDGVGMVEFSNLDPTRTYEVDLYARDKTSTTRRFRLEGYPNGMGVVVS
jgi:hypothetical protein